jgi:hypothetical protein
MVLGILKMNTPKQGYEMDNREIARKVGHRLKMDCPAFIVQKAENNPALYDQFLTGNLVFAAIKDAEKRGWQFVSDVGGSIRFIKFNLPTDIAISATTDLHSVEIYGYIKAILIAYLEIPDE